MILRLLIECQAKARVGYLYAEHACAIGYAASEGWEAAHALIKLASAVLILMLAIYSLAHGSRKVHAVLRARHVNRKG